MNKTFQDLTEIQKGSKHVDFPTWLRLLTDAVLLNQGKKEQSAELLRDSSVQRIIDSGDELPSIGYKREIEAIRRVTEKACQSPETARQYLRDAGILAKTEDEAEESGRPSYDQIFENVPKTETLGHISTSENSGKAAAVRCPNCQSAEKVFYAYDGEKEFLSCGKIFTTWKRQDIPDTNVGDIPKKAENLDTSAEHDQKMEESGQDNTITNIPAMIHTIEKMNDAFTKHHIFLDGFTAVLHHFTGIDKGGPHDHPFGFHSHIIQGSYIERVYHLKNGGVYWEDIERRPGTAHYVSATHIHEIIALPQGECWTLITPGKWERHSCFWKFEKSIYVRKWWETEYSLFTE